MAVVGASGEIQAPDVSPPPGELSLIVLGEHPALSEYHQPGAEVVTSRSFSGSLPPPAPDSSRTRLAARSGRAAATSIAVWPPNVWPARVAGASALSQPVQDHDRLPIA
ncbi:hypothetical protein [Pseudarthrobacter sp. DSP2-3-2b1]|uniref:hypothetical protein n=1 Tax=Pseudarthrobacter sp. DSP2-3-2b1 TaxID=2804661 RepID=UPI003CF8DCA9